MDQPRAALYVRLSVASDRSTSIEGQTTDLHALAAREGWHVVATFTDNGQSGGKERANAREALDMLRRGDADVLAVYAYDRYSRLGIAEVGDIIRVIDERAKTSRPAVFVADREGIRSDRGEDWQLRLAFAADLAKRERDRIVARTTASQRRLRESLRWAGGAVPWGYRTAPRPDGPGLMLEPEPTEGPVIREGVARIAAGESLASIARDLTRRGIPKPRSPYRTASLRGEDPSGLTRGTWPVSTVRTAFLAESLLGRYKQGPGRGYVDAWEPVVDLADMQRARARFADAPGRGRQFRRRAARLLSGLVYCDGCGGVMYSRTDTRNGTAVYYCAARPRGVACEWQGQTVQAEPLERHVADAFLARAGALPEVETLEIADDTAALLADVRARITETTSALAKRGADRVALLEALDDLLAEEERLDALPPRVTQETRTTGRTVAEAWDADDAVGRRRSLLSGWLEVVTIRGRSAIFEEAAGRRLTRRDGLFLERVAVEWRPEADAVAFVEASG